MDRVAPAAGDADGLVPVPTPAEAACRCPTPPSSCLPEDVPPPSPCSPSPSVAFAFPEQAGDMVPADAFSLQECSSCPNGAQLRQFYLGGTSSGDIEPSSNIPLSGVNATATTGGGLAAVFEGPLPTGANASALPLIFAAGAVYSNGYIR